MTQLGRQLAHRGPDDIGTFFDPDFRVGLVQRRLSIIDISAGGHQPMSDTTGSHQIIFNGEIYNYRELRRELEAEGSRFRSNSDTEVILAGLIRKGTAFLSRLRGMFAIVWFAKHSATEASLVLARDSLGIKPLVYSEGPQGLAFASEVRALAAAGFISREVSREALNDYLTYGSVAQPRTIYREAFQLEPGTYRRYRLSDGKLIEKEAFFDLNSAMARIEIPQTYEEQVRETRRLLEEAIDAHLVADVPVGCFLSGGIDSSAIAALMQKRGPHRLKTFSLGFRSEDEVPSEHSAAASTAAFLGAEHYERLVGTDELAHEAEDFFRRMDQPTVDGFNTYLISAFARPEVKVSLSGLGGDELFGGYPHFQAFAEASEGSRPLPARLREIYSPRRNQRMLKEYSAPVEIAWEAAAPRRSPLSDLGRYELRHYLLNTLLRDADAMSMAHSLEVRPILLDLPFVLWALMLPDSAKIRAGRSKSVLVDAVVDLLPPDLLKLPKRGFELPFAQLLNGPLKADFLRQLKGEPARRIFSCSVRWQTMLMARVGRLSRQKWLWYSLLKWFEHSGAELPG